ncbi:hypothetical protein MPH_01828 [Macrophomina phaseolina MS6]|uniref:Carboxylesterase type B domain-containing protein n=1 Tax=Macrophomina phaseolina (strain MS6) TaxID=1126212 RepID=K2SW92_MACPH|nr:hypothetical protein MPH_01828 [Macrophomina phaseolina MS6]
MVNLGYGCYRASTLRQATGYYEFLDIRYAAAPLDHLRFQPAVPPRVGKPFIQEYRERRICPQAASSLPPAAIQPKPQSSVNQTVPLHHSSKSDLKPDRRQSETEDCLFLDIYVPKPILDRRRHVVEGEIQGVPVIVWIHGGEHTSGSKALLDGPIDISRNSWSHHSHPSFILVSINYRLGAFGWLSGISLEAQNGTSNVGLHDQRMALHWVQDHIHLFGGDGTRIAVIDNNTSVKHDVPRPVPSLIQHTNDSPLRRYSSPLHKLHDRTFEEFLRFANVSSLTEARSLTSERLIAANAAVFGSIS